jgi:predicted nucleic acid-binding protein
LAPACVLDASSVFPWLFEDEATPEADAMLAMVGAQGAVVPSLWHIEIANGLGMAERRNRISQAEVADAVALLRGLPLAVDDMAPAHAFGTVLELMRDNRLTAYDAVYLELAIRSRLPIATNDRALRRAAASAGVPLPRSSNPDLSHWAARPAAGIGREDLEPCARTPRARAGRRKEGRRERVSASSQFHQTVTRPGILLHGRHIPTSKTVPAN